MKRFILIPLFLGLLFESCEPLPASPAAPSTPATRVVPTTPSAVAGGNGPASIPLPVGHGVDGGWYQLYFTDPSDPASDQLSGGVDEPLVAAIDAAQLSVDAALYSLSLNSVRRALIQAHRRGVAVRVVMESDNLDRSDPEALKEAGIALIGDRREGLMHHKFVVIDTMEVWTGSMNLTEAGTYADRNNLIRIRSAEVAADYEAEFEEMFVDDKFGPDRGKPTPHPEVTLEGTQLDIYFSPDDRVQAGILALIQDARSSIYFLAYSFTADPLGDAIRARAQAGVAVKGVMDGDQVSGAGSEYDSFRAAGLDVRLDGEPGLMHHKVLIIDEEIVVAGSYNFTASAEKYNDENVIVFHSPEIAAWFLEEFQRNYAAAEP